MEEQVATIFAVGQGLMDDVPVERLKEFEAAMLRALRDQPSEALATIRDTGKLEDETAARLKTDIEDFKRNHWQKSREKAEAKA